MNIIKPPQTIFIPEGNKSVFLAGSIGLPDSGGSASNW